MTNDELTPSEKKAMDALPRDKEPSAFLEERTVRALRKDGSLRTRGRRHIEVTVSRVISAVAASIVLIVGGFTLGQWTGSQRTTRPVVESVDTGNLDLAVHLQRTGTAYLSALDQFAEHQGEQGGGTDSDAAQGREVALTTLYAAVDETTRIVPEGAVASLFLQMLEQARSTESAVAAGSQDEREPQMVIWF
jgi:hypothetical protein